MPRLSFPLFTALCGLTLAACSTSSVNESDPEALFNEAEAEIKSDRYQMAIDRLRMLKSKFPYSKLASLAQLRIADVYYKQELFQEAALSYETFRDLHPKHEKAAYALFRIGESYRSDLPSNIGRDLSSAAKAVEAYEAFVRQYPGDERIADAKDAIKTVRSVMARRELMIGNFYYSENQFESAKGRYEKILQRFPETDSAAEARTRLAKAEEKLKE